MRVLGAGACAMAGTAAPRPSAARPPARKFRRAGSAGASVARQQAQPRKTVCRKGFCDVECHPAKLVLIPGLICFVVGVVAGKLSGSRGAGKPARAIRRRGAPLPPRAAQRSVERDEALKVFLQNLLDSPLIAFMWGNCRCWLVRVD